MNPEFLKKVLKTSNLTLKKIAEQASLNPRTVERWVSDKNANPGSTDLYKFCKILEITMEQAVDGESGQKYVESIIPPFDLSSKERDLLLKFSQLKLRDQKEILMLIDLKLSSLP